MRIELRRGRLIQKVLSNKELLNVLIRQINVGRDQKRRRSTKQLGFTLMMEAAKHSETSVHFCHTAHCNIP